MNAIDFCESEKEAERISMGERKVQYFLDQQDKLKFTIENFTRAKPFASFLPGIAGVTGIPLWCFYTNRGQGIAGFGIESKDGAIMEFQPANKAYRLTPTHGFRTFLKYRIDGKEGFYEPFQETLAYASSQRENKMTISPYDVALEEINSDLGLSVTVRYFTVPEEPLAALAREVVIKNIGNAGEFEIELLDGMPLINPYGITNENTKNMSRTIEAWAFAENLENDAPYFRLKVLSDDSAEVIPVREGNFYFGFYEEDGKSLALKPIIDVETVFGHCLDLSYPERFCRLGFSPLQPQHFENRTPCAFGYAKFRLAAGGSQAVYSYIGHVGGVGELNRIRPAFMEKSFFHKKSEWNEKLVRELMDQAFISSNSETFDAYARQTFLDNLLRGGMPVTVQSERGRDVIYLYSRKHGDMERDYNDFRIAPTFFSQGNGNYRDINQNRRNDIWLNTDAGYSNIKYFMNLVQLDGYNPLVTRNYGYIYEGGEKLDAEIRELLCEDGREQFFAFLKKPFLLQGLITFIHQENIGLKAPVEALIQRMIPGCRKYEEAVHGEGYWTDHGFYNTDLLESFEGVFPDRMKELLHGDRSFSFYDDAYYVVPRKEKYVLHKGKAMQLKSVRKVEDKLKLIAARDREPHKVRVQNGSGEVYYTCLFTKLICFCVNKMASLDPFGVGIEMEAGKPNWNDALNGLPGLFGSSVNETFELIRLMELMQSWIEKYNLGGEELQLPDEFHEFLGEVCRALEINTADNSEAGNFAYWDRTYTAKEAFREKVLYGLGGNEKSVSIKEVQEFLSSSLKKLADAKKMAFDEEQGIYNTYFIHEPVEIELPDGENTAARKEKKNTTENIRVRRFKQIPLPPFLEGQVHALKIEKEETAALALYHSIRKSGIYDSELKMYKTNASLAAAPQEVGRLTAFTPGWLENESIFLHMEHKYLLEMLKAGMADQFFEDAKTCFVPFMNPEVYGRSILENSSFIASSANPDAHVHGRGFVARLSGTTAEFYNILLVMALGTKPFCLNDAGEPELKVRPCLPEWLFAREAKTVKLYGKQGVRTVELEANTFSFHMLGNVLLVYHNDTLKNTFGEEGVRAARIVLQGDGEERLEFLGDTISAPYAAGVRNGAYNRIDIWLA